MPFESASEYPSSASEYAHTKTAQRGDAGGDLRSKAKEAGCGPPRRANPPRLLAGVPLLTKKHRRMRLDPSFCEVQPARALYRGGVNNGGCIYESEKVRSKPFNFVPLGRILRAAIREL